MRNANTPLYAKMRTVSGYLSADFLKKESRTAVRLSLSRNFIKNHF